MFQPLITVRAAAIVTIAVCEGTLLRVHVPWPADDPVIGLIALQRPQLLTALHAVYVVLLYSTPAMFASALLAAHGILRPFRRAQRAITPRLPLYPSIADRTSLSLVVGELHHPTRPIPVPNPTWLELPEHGLYGGMIVIGAKGSGKTTTAIYPFAEQLLGFAARDPERRIGGLTLDVKGDFNKAVQAILTRHNRVDDYVELSLAGQWRHNPLHNSLDAYSLAYGLASLLNQLVGRSPDPFWSLASTNLLRFLIVLHRLLNGYVTFVDLYRCAISPKLFEDRLREARKRWPDLSGAPPTATTPYVQVPLVDFARHQTILQRFPFTSTKDGSNLTAPLTPDLFAIATDLGLTIVDPQRVAERDGRIQIQIDAVERWYTQDWTNLHPRLRTSIVEGVSAFFSLFDVDPDVQWTFCPPQSLYTGDSPKSESEGRPLPPFRELIETGKIVALNLPVTAAPGLGRLVGVLLKLEHQHAVLSRIPDLEPEAVGRSRPVLCLIDEYHLFTTAGGDEPVGDEQFLSLDRQARSIPIFTTQSLSSLRAVLPGETWRALFQQFRTRIFLTISDDFTAAIASDLCGRTDQVVPSYNVSESAQHARVSWLDANTVSPHSTITTSHSYSVQRLPTFESRQFTELANGQAIVLAYDGRRPLPPQYCYLRPHYRDPRLSHFDHRSRLQPHATQPRHHFAVS
jgi:hypothetical protein